jgi:hypothetical protein
LAPVATFPRKQLTIATHVGCWLREECYQETLSSWTAGFGIIFHDNTGAPTKEICEGKFRQLAEASGTVIKTEKTVVGSADDFELEKPRFETQRSSRKKMYHMTKVNWTLKKRLSNSQAMTSWPILAAFQRMLLALMEKAQERRNERFILLYLRFCQS